MFNLPFRLPGRSSISLKKEESATGASAIAVELDDVPLSGSLATLALLEAMLRAREQVSDLIFSPGRAPQVEVHGQLLTVQVPGLASLTADDTRRIAADLIGNNKQAITTLREQGTCDISYGLPGVARFRVNIFIQRGSVAVVMRVIPTNIPGFEALGLPAHLKEIASLREGIVLVSGARGSGKSSTLAALLDGINQEQTCHIITIEDPIEFLHSHKRATVHQRELHSDTPSYAIGLRAAMRQAPKVIMVGETRDRETMEMLLEAAETGHLVLSSLNTFDVAKTLERILSWCSHTEQEALRRRLAKSLRCIVSQRLIPRANGKGRVAVMELLKANAQTRQYLEYGDLSQSLLQALKDGAEDGMQEFDDEIEKQVRAGVINAETGVSYATNPGQLAKVLAGTV